MKRILPILIGLCCFAFAKAQTIDTNAVDGQILVKIKNTSSEVFADFNGDTSTLHNDLVSMWANYGITSISKPFAAYTSYGWTQKTYLFEFSDIDSVMFLINNLEALSYIEDADKNYLFRLSYVPNDFESSLSTFNNKNWHLKKVNAEYGWDIASTNPVRVAVIDNEMDLNHPDFMGRFILPSDQADGDLNTVGPTVLSHGTHVAGLVGARTDNDTGVASIAGRNPNLKIIPIKVAENATSSYGSLNAIAIVNGILYADANGTNIISMSLGSINHLALENAVASAIGNGRLFVCAAGNSNTTDSTFSFPAAYNQNPAYSDNIICVGATDEQDHKSSFSNYGGWVDVMAPGSNIYSTDNTEINHVAGGYYSYKSGTSMATPMVASLCAYIYGIDNTLSAVQIKNIVLTTARDVYNVNPTYPGQMGTGVIDMYAAGLTADSSFEVNFSASAVNVCPGSNVSLNAFAGPGVTITSWSWSFSSAVTYVSGSSSSQNITISVAAPTVLSATLTAVTTTSGTVTIVKPNYINFGRPQADLVSTAAGGICNGSPQNFILNFSGGVPPFDYTITNTYTAFSDTAFTSVAMYYTVADPNYPVYQITSVTDATGCTSTNLASDTLQIIDCCQNLITNGDFENGNTGFSSDNVYSCTTTSQGYYGVNTFPTPTCAAFTNYIGGRPQNFQRHMSFVYDGPTSSGQATVPGGANTTFVTPVYNNTTYQHVVWEQSTPVLTAGHNYNIDYFAFQYFTSASEVHLETRILDSLNNVLFDTIKVVEGAYSGYWQQHSFMFNNPSYSGWATVQIRQVHNFHTSQYDIGIDDISLRRNNISDASAFAGLDTAICYGQVVTLSGSGGPSYSWSPSASLDASNIAMPVASPTTTTMYTLSVTNVGCGTTYDSVKVTVYGGPSMTLTPATSTICLGQGVMLTSSGGVSPYQWYENGNLMPFNQGAQYVAPTVTTIYTIENVLPNGCKSWATATVTVNSPTVTVGPRPAEICQGGPGITLTAGGATTYTWTPPIGLSATTGSTVTANPPTTRTYTVTGTQGGCNDTDTITVTVNPLPTITISPTTATVCIGSFITLSGGGASTYTWSPNAGGVNTNTVSVSPTTNTTYTLYGTSAAGCQSQLTRTVTTFTVPVVGVSPTTYTLCSGNNVLLTGSGASGGYTWTPSGTLSAATGATVTATPTTTTTYTVTGSNAAGCTAQATAAITVNTTPTVSMVPTNTTYCVGTPLTLTASGGTTYSWTPSAGLSAASGTTVTATPSVTTTYTVSGTTAGCSATASSTITAAANTCYAAAGIVPRDTTYTTAQTNFGTGVTLGGSLAIIGNVTFTTGSNVIGCYDVRIAPGVKITVANTATLTVLASYLRSCSTCGGGMWDGIYVENGGKLVISGGTRIEDATDAVSVEAYNASEPIPDVQISQTIFNRNTTGVKMQLGTINTTNYQPSLTSNVVDNCVFTCRTITNTGLTLPVTSLAQAQANFNVMKDSVYNNVYSTNTTTNAGVRSSIGIRIHRVGSATYPFVIGEAGTTTSHGVGKINLFDNLDFGVSAQDSRYVVKNCQFQYSKGNSASLVGIGISSLRDPLVSVGCTQTTVAANEGCVFKDLLRGIHIGNITTNVYIHKNTFTNSFTDTYSNFPSGNRTGQYGVYMQPVGGAGVVVKIDSNSITNCALGIHFLRSSGYTGTGIYINDNTITANGTTNAYCNKGIFMEDVSSSTAMASGSIEIKRNTITNIEEKVIHCSGLQSGLDIACNNELSLRYRATGGTMTGGATFDVIRLDNCKNSFTRFNNYIRTSSGNTLFANLALTGIYVNNTVSGINNVIDANDIRYLGVSMVFQGSNPTGTLIRRNVMTLGRYGLYMNTGAAFNTQGAGNKNRWGTPAAFATTFQTHNANGSNVNTMAQFNVYTGSGAGTGYTYAPTSHTFSSGSAYTTGPLAIDGFITTSTNPASCINCASTCGGNYNFPPIDCEDCEDPQGQMLVSGGFNENQSMESGGDTESTGNEEMQRIIEGLINDTTVSMEYNSQRLWANYKWAFEQMYNNPDISNGNANLQAFYSSTINAPIGLITQAEQYMENGQYADANTVLSAVSPENSIEQYLVDVYRMGLNKFLDTTYIYSENEMNALYAIASECELASGPAVLKARALVNKIVEGYVPFDNTCFVSADARISRLEDKSKQVVNFSLYPNPTSGNLTVKFDAVRPDENAAIGIYSMDGKLLAQTDIEVYSNTAKLSLKELQNGVYIVRFSKNELVLTNERLVIMK